MGDHSGAQLAPRQLMPPPASRPPRQKVKVLDEDEWTEKIEAIIQRDFFPDVPKLQNKLEWLQVIIETVLSHWTLCV
jgi:protein DGCR14